MEKPLKNFPIGLVVVSFSSHSELTELISSLNSSSRRIDHLVVVENGPLQPSVKAPRGSTLTVVHLPHNPGYGHAINEGMKRIPKDVDWVFLANPDVLLEPNTLEILLTEASQHPAVGSAGPALLNPDGTTYPSARAIPSVGIGIGHALLGWLWKSNPWTRAYRGEYDSLEPRAVGWLSGAFLLVSKKAFNSVGGFDTAFFMFMEDVDLGMRLGHAGYQNLYVPKARAIHEVGHSTGKVRVEMARAHHESAKRFIEKRYPGPTYSFLKAALKTGLSLRSAIVQAVRKLGA